MARKKRKSRRSRDEVAAHLAELPTDRLAVFYCT